MKPSGRPMMMSKSSDTSTRTSSSSSTAAPATSSSPHRFYILRHGETDANASGVIQGSSDVSRLTPKGREQAATIAKSALIPILSSSNTTRHRRIDSIYCSPLTRARETLSILRQTLPRHVLPPDGTETILDDMREIDFYTWEMRNKKELMTHYPEEYAAWKAGNPDGLVVDGQRPLWEIWDRAARVWEEIRSRGHDVRSGIEGGGGGSGHEDENENETTATTLLVCHGTLGQALLSSAFGLDATVFRRNEFPNCGMAEVLWHPKKDMASKWRWRYPDPTELGCLRDQLLGTADEPA